MCVIKLLLFIKIHKDSYFYLKCLNFVVYGEIEIL